MPNYPSIVATGRGWADSRMGAGNGASTAAVKRQTGATVPGPDGYLVAEWVTVYVDLPMRIGGFWGSGPSKDRDIGGAETQVANRTAHFPADTTDLRDGDFIEITAGENAGLVLRIIETDWQDQATARRVPVTSVERPTEWT